jgi:hypothetical protein
MYPSRRQNVECNQGSRGSTFGRVQVEAYAKVMGYRNPQRYGNRIDVNLTQTVDIGSSLAKMQERLDATYRDVTPAIEGAKAKDIKDLL